MRLVSKSWSMSPRGPDPVSRHPSQLKLLELFQFLLQCLNPLPLANVSHKCLRCKSNGSWQLR